MCTPTIMIGIAVGAAVGATTSAITGGDPLMGAIMGGITGGITGGISPGSLGMTGIPGLDPLGTTFSIGGVGIAGGTLASSVAMSGVAGIGLGMLTPQQQDYNLANTGMPYAPQAYSSQHSTVTGSGGRQAAAVLASEIKQAKSLRQRQAEVADYGLGMSVAGTGLQIA